MGVLSSLWLLLLYQTLCSVRWTMQRGAEHTWAPHSPASIMMSINPLLWWATLSHNTCNKKMIFSHSLLNPSSDCISILIGSPFDLHSPMHTIKPLIYDASNPKIQIFLISSCSCHCWIHWSQVLSQEWGCCWSNADRQCSNYIWVINDFIAY